MHSHYSLKETFFFAKLFCVSTQPFKLTRELNARSDTPKVSAASSAEVERVLAEKTDLDVMQVKPGSSTAVIKKRYRAMTLALHPDKCKVNITHSTCDLQNKREKLSEAILSQGSCREFNWSAISNETF